MMAGGCTLITDKVHGPVTGRFGRTTPGGRGRGAKGEYSESGVDARTGRSELLRELARFKVWVVALPRIDPVIRSPAFSAPTPVGLFRHPISHNTPRHGPPTDGVPHCLHCCTINCIEKFKFITSDWQPATNSSYQK